MLDFNRGMQYFFLTAHYTRLISDLHFGVLIITKEAMRALIDVNKWLITGSHNVHNIPNFQKRVNKIWIIYFTYFADWLYNHGPDDSLRLTLFITQ